ncbi:hypothetical protein FE257_002838 [Aspergillus nanangensis]|uniref:Uncharacterized protein n=1 Tax=Aspergillus nanangensis TaxID=2582783 RepID=A0AAD4CSP6_ASPNN|nr:hypothetical protein FE257_002838 [Aspergillus nanangensis]
MMLRILFYTECLEARYNCGPSGYPLDAGYKYCSKALEVQDTLSPAGQTWVTDAMLCLEEKLIPLATQEEPGTCAELNDYALSSHPDCYVKSGWCALPLNDWTTILDVVFPFFFSEIHAVKEAFEVAIDCALIQTF